MSDVTRILSQIESGDQQASEVLLPLVYDELRKLAAARMANERADHTLSATALVHEAYVRLVDVDQVQKWDSRGHFFAAAGEAMRRILVEHARRKLAKQRGGEMNRVDDLEEIESIEDLSRALEVDEALARLDEADPTIASLVKLRFFAGFSIPDAANALGIPRTTAYLHWTYAKKLMARLLA
jgi:RNA polymerase sigma factor (TIGR02999 family)